MVGRSSADLLGARRVGRDRHAGGVRLPAGEHRRDLHPAGRRARVSFADTQHVRRGQQLHAAADSAVRADGEILWHSNMAFKALDVLDKLLGRLTGRLSILTVATGTVFAS